MTVRPSSSTSPLSSAKPSSGGGGFRTAIPVYIPSALIPPLIRFGLVVSAFGAFLTLIVLWQNTTRVPVRFLHLQADWSLAYLLLLTVLSSAALISLLCYSLTAQQRRLVASLQRQLRDKDSEIAKERKKFDQLRQEASKVQVPCPLDRLVEKGWRI